MVELNGYLVVLILLAGFAAGFINTLAGSGSIISLPLLMFLGLPANVANGTNRVMIILSNAVGLVGFRKHGEIKLKGNVGIAIPTIIGALIGAVSAVHVNEKILTRIIGALMIVLFFMVIYKPEKWLKTASPDHTTHPSWGQYVFMFFIGFYGGFLQLGVGVFLLSGLVLGAGYDLVKANAIKVLIILVYTLFILPVFIWNHQVNFTAGLILAAGSMIGAYVASRVAVSWGPKFVRYILLGVILVAAVKFLGVFDWIKLLI